ncbi:MAG TPA: LysR family transcriptional regulator [Rhodanobacteraceae bacterium]|nr:LysR family transcriptional regulator [Rhodanobacteraceae bacterium]
MSVEPLPPLARALSDTDLRLLRVFQTVVRCGGLTAAESELDIGRSTISRHLKALEERLGATLCHRGRSGFVLTDEGTRVFDAAERLLAAVGQFRTEVEEINDHLRGHLRVALFDKTVTNPAANIAGALGDFATRAPEVGIEMHVGPTNQIEAGVIDGAWQVGIIPTHRPSPALDYIPLFREQMVLYCGRSHPLFARPDQRGNEREVWAQKYAGLGFHSPNMETGNAFGLTRAAEASDQEAIATLILSGRYIGFLPEHYAEPFVARQLVRPLHPERFRYTCEFAAIYRRSPPPSRLLDIFLACLRRAHATPAPAAAVTA